MRKHNCLHKIDASVIIYIIFVIAEGLAIYYGVQKKIILNENQIMYLSSTGAQLDGEIIKDETLIDVFRLIRRMFSKRVIIAGISTFVSILLCEYNILCGTKEILFGRVFGDVILNNSLVFITFTSIIIINFVFTIVNPDRFEKVSTNAKWKMDEKSTVGTPDNLDETNPKIGSDYQDIYILGSANILSNELIGRLNALRKYKNYVLHGSDMIVSNEYLAEARDIESQLKRVKSEKPIHS